MTNHDQLAKSLIRVFFTDVLRLIDPALSTRLRADEATFLDKEDFTDWPVGERREMDLLARVPVEGGEETILVHVEIEREHRSGMDHRLWQYYMQLRLRHGVAVLPILVNLRGGRPGPHRAVLREGFDGGLTATFHYRVLSLSGCRAEDWLGRPEPVAWAFAALMRPGRWSRAELKVECLRRIAGSGEKGLRRQILVDWVETYVQLNEAEALAFQRLLDREGNEEIKHMELTWLGQAEARGLEKGIVQGARSATQQAVERMRRVVLRQMEQRFGTVPVNLRSRIEAIDTLEPLADLAEQVFTVPTIADLVVG